MPIRNFVLLIGAMKSGTTSLFEHLAQHPAIAGAEPKEPGFFAFDETFARGRAWYESLFDFDPARHGWAMDGTTDYSKAPYAGDVRARMAQIPDAEFRLIYIMRHPLRRVESHARHTQIARKEVGQHLSDRPDHGLDAGISPVSMAATHYAGQLDAYRDLFDDGKVLLVALEEFSAAPRAVADRIFAFLGLPPVALPLAGIKNEAGDARRRLPLWDWLRRVPSLSSIVRRLVPAKVRRAIDARLTRPVRITGRFRLTEAEECMLLAELTPDLLRLRDVYGFDVERWWGIDLPARTILAPTPM